MEVKTELSDEVFCQKAEQKGIKLTPLSQYYLEPPETVEHIFIINYSSLAEDCMKEAIERIYLCLSA